MKKQQGFLAIAAVILIVIIGFLGTVVAYMISGSTSGANNFALSDRALYIAEGGLEQTTRLLLTPKLSGTNARIGCASITGSTNLTNTSLGAGTFTATNTSGSPVYVNTTLSSALSSTATTISVASTSGFSPSGRLIIEGENINYGAISGNTFIAVQRGVNQSYNTPHVSGARVSQYQCNFDVKGGVPNLTTPLYQRELQQSVALQEAVAVADASGTAYIMSRWNRPSEAAWSNVTIPSAVDQNLKSVSMLSNADGWAVGNANSTAFTILHWTGSSWALATAPTACSGENLNGVSAVYTNEVWAVGVDTKAGGACGSGGSRRYTVLKWNGSTWTALAPSTIPADSSGTKTLNAVHVIDTNQSGAGNFGFAVGVGGIIIKYNGSTWTAVTSPTTNNLLGVYVVSATEAWAVGASGTIIKWNGTSWSTVTSPTTTQLNAVFMVNPTLTSTATLGWAVGNAGVAVRYNGSSWSSNNTGVSQNLLSVAMFNSISNEDVWAGGASGMMQHYDGTSWSTVPSNVSQGINSISVISPQQFPFAWEEVYN